MIKSISIIALAMSIIGGCGKQMKSVAVSQYDGTWAESEDENALFIIKGDTVKNVEHGDKMYFTIVGDSMIIDYVDSKAKYFVIRSSDDSLVLRNPDNSITRLYKRRR
jgi:hypothetical protein